MTALDSRVLSAWRPHEKDRTRKRRQRIAPGPNAPRGRTKPEPSRPPSKRPRILAPSAPLEARSTRCRILIPANPHSESRSHRRAPSSPRDQGRDPIIIAGDLPCRLKTQESSWPGKKAVSHLEAPILVG